MEEIKLTRFNGQILVKKKKQHINTVTCLRDLLINKMFYLCAVILGVYK